MKEKIDGIIEESITILKRSLSVNLDAKKILIDSSFFNHSYCDKNDITKCELHSELFEELKSIRKPILYWFDFEYSEERNNKISNKYRNYRDKIKLDYSNNKYRNTAAYKSTFNSESKTLYVGKVETGFWGRLVTHLGYNSNPRTAGMQLHHWYFEEFESFGNLTLNYIVFDNEMKHLISVLEKKLALELRPLIGKY
jgi:hypothetical protein